MTDAHFDVIVIGAGAAGLMCAAEAGRRGRRVLVIDTADRPGKKILISGGGRCNFTNTRTVPDRFISANKHFAISALKRFTPAHFIERVRQRGIAFHEKALGQLFCDDSARDILGLLLDDCEAAGVHLRLSCLVEMIEREDRFILHTTAGQATCESLVIATGGLSIPKMGASGFGYELARHFDIEVEPTRPGLVPLTFAPSDPRNFCDLTGLACDVEIRCGKTKFQEALLFTHRGISGPAVLQISSYWRDGQPIEIDFAPGLDLAARLKAGALERPKAALKTVLGDILPRRLAERMLPDDIAMRQVCTIGLRTLDALAADIKSWRVNPSGSEGYRTAEVTIGGVSTNDLSSQTMMAKNVPGLYFIGEVVDVTGWLGGYNFQWAWSSGWVAGQVV